MKSKESVTSDWRAFTTGASNGTNVMGQSDFWSGTNYWTRASFDRELNILKILFSEKLNSIEGIRLTRFGLYGSSVRINGQTAPRSCIPVYSSYDKRHFTMTVVSRYRNTFYEVWMTLCDASLMQSRFLCSDGGINKPIDYRRKQFLGSY